MTARLWTIVQVLGERRAQERSCRWSHSQLEAHQLRETQALRRFALERSAFYRRFHRGLDDRPLAELPVLSKALLMENFDEVVTDPALKLAELEAYLARGEGDALFRDRYVVLSTSGSTGRRGVFVFDPREWIRALAAITRPIAWQAEPRSLLRPVRSALIASSTWWHYSARVGQALSSRLMPTLRIDAATPLAEMVRRLNEWRPAALAAYPSVLRVLAEEQVAGRLDIPLRSIGTSAEVLTPQIRRRVSEAWGARIYNTYGATEYAPIATECAAGNLHLLEDGAVIEIADHRGRALPPGEPGERVLISVFGRRTQPLIRYELSDVLRAAPGECACGRPFRMLSSIEGRLEDVLDFPSRESAAVTVSIHPNLFHEILERVAVAGWQVVQESDALRVDLLDAQDLDGLAPLEQTVRALLESRGARVPVIHVRQVTQLERGATGKAPLIVSQLKRTPAAS